MKKLLGFFKTPPLWFLLILAAIGIGAMVGGTIIMTQERLSSDMVWGYTLLGVMSVAIGY